jgi:hypothetical protein
MIDLDGMEWRTLEKDHPFGWCCECGAPVTMRQQTPGPKDLCIDGHLHWAALTRRTPPEATHGTTES